MDIGAVEAWAKAVILSVDPTLNVYPHERIVLNYDHLVEDFGIGAADPDDDLYEQTRGWIVTVDRVTPDFAGSYLEHDVRLNYFHSLYSRGASEAAFDAHMAAVWAAFRDDRGSTLTGCFDMATPVVDELRLVEWPAVGGR